LGKCRAEAFPVKVLFNDPSPAGRERRGASEINFRVILGRGKAVRIIFLTKHKLDSGQKPHQLNYFELFQIQLHETFLSKIDNPILFQ